MGPLTHKCREGIVQFTLNMVAAAESRMAERRVGEMVLVSQGARHYPLPVFARFL